MAIPDEVRKHFRWQARFLRAEACPITATVCETLADVLDENTATGRRLLNWPGKVGPDLVALRLVAGFHNLARSGRDPALSRLYAGAAVDATEVIGSALAHHDAELEPWLDGPPQTNEPGRSAALMCGYLALAQRFAMPFEVLEIGSSAGLNLLMDRFRIELGGVAVGPADSPLVLRPEWRGPPPPSAAVRFASLRGVDLAPIDITRPGAAERLLAYVWVDQTIRVAVLDTALAMARLDPPPVAAGDAGAWIEAQLASPQEPGVCRVVAHSIVWQYLPDATQARIRAAIEAAGARATAETPLAWLAFEPSSGQPDVAVSLRVWPGAGEEELVARSQPHGLWVEGIAGAG